MASQAAQWLRIWLPVQETSGLPSMGSQRVRHDWVTNAFTFIQLPCVWHDDLTFVHLAKWLSITITVTNFFFPVMHTPQDLGFPDGHSGKEPACQCSGPKRHRFDPWVRKIPWRGAWQPTRVFLPRESHGQRNLVGYSPKGCKESDTTKVI